jgi:hypothetical protein
MLGFKQYIDEKFTKMTPREFLKYDWRIDVFLRKYKEKESFDMADGSIKTFVYDPSIARSIETRDTKNLGDVRLTDADGNEYRLSDIGKSKDFGGKGAGAGTAKEDIELKILRDQLDRIRSELGRGTVPIRIAGKVYDVAGVESTPGTPKSDFHLVDANDNEIVWISHKDGKSAKDFQQWGGISKRKEPKVSSHTEVQKFVEDLKNKYPDGLPRATSLYRPIKDSKLKMMSIYGNDYGKKFGRQNVTIMLQGPVKLEKTGDVYEFRSNHVHVNGEKMTGDYEPVLTAVYKGDRSDSGVKGTRIVIMPKGGRKMKGTI